MLEEIAKKYEINEPYHLYFNYISEYFKNNYLNNFFKVIVQCINETYETNYGNMNGEVKLTYNNLMTKLDNNLNLIIKNNIGSLLSPYDKRSLKNTFDDLTNLLEKIFDYAQRKSKL